MSARLLDGIATASAIKGELKERVAALAARGVVPGLGQRGLQGQGAPPREMSSRAS